MREKRTTAALLISLIAAAAVVVSAYLAWKTLTAGPVVGCGAETGAACDDILASRWSKWLGVPVSLLAVGVYTAMIAAAWAAALRPRRLTLGLLTFLSLSAIGAGAWFVGVQAFALHGFCPWCLTVHACGMLAALLTCYMISNATDDNRAAATLMSATVRGVRSTKPTKRQTSGTQLASGTLLGALGAVLGLAVLACGQLLAEDERPGLRVVEILPDEAPMNSDPLNGDQPSDEPAGGAADPHGDADQPFELAPIELVADPEEPHGDDGGERAFRFTALARPVRLDEMPVLGGSGAKNVVVEVVDYTCPHCRQLHPHVEAALERHDGDLAFVVHHLPLNSGCNPNIPADAPINNRAKHACEFARLAVSVWLRAPEEFQDYHDWLMTGEEPPRITKARVRAADIIGDSVLLDNDLRNEALERIESQCELLKSLKGGLPVLLFRYDSVQGVPKDDERFEQLLEQKFGR